MGTLQEHTKLKFISERILGRILNIFDLGPSQCSCVHFIVMCSFRCQC